jgi:hypothetical protein
MRYKKLGDKINFTDFVIQDIFTPQWEASANRIPNQ